MIQEHKGPALSAFFALYYPTLPRDQRFAHDLKVYLQQTQVLAVAQNFKDTRFIFFFKSSLFIYMCARAHTIAHECYEDNLQALVLFLPP